MKLIARWIFSFAAVSLLVLVLGALVVVSIGSKRDSKLYRIKVAVLGLIVTLLGGGLTGAGCLPRSETLCYVSDLSNSWDYMEEEPLSDLEADEADDLTQEEEYDIPEVEQADEPDGLECDVPDAQACEAIDIVEAEDVEAEGDAAGDISGEDIDGA